MKDWLTLKALAVAVPVILGPLAYLASRYVLNAWTWIDSLPATAKRGVVLAIAIGLAAAAQVAGITLPGECSDVGTGAVTDSCRAALSSPVFLKGILGALVAFLLHSLKKSDPRV